MPTIENVSFVIAPESSWWREYAQEAMSMPPMGLLYLATFVQDRYNTQVLDLTVGNHNREEFVRCLNEAPPDVIGFTVFPTNWPHTRELLAVAKERFPRVRTVAGGPLATFVGPELLQAEPLLDYVLAYEGEYGIRNLLSALEKDDPARLATVPGLRCRDPVTSKIVQAAPDAPIQDLDELPFVDRSYVNMASYRVPFSIFTARGCPARCIFCTAHNMHRGFRWRSADNVIAEVKKLIDNYDIHGFFIADDTFTAIPKRAIEICHKLERLPRKLRWICESRADAITPELAHTLANAGCYKVQIGLESADNDILRKLRKGITVQDVENAVRDLYEAGINVAVSFIFGHAFDTPETMDRLLCYVEHLIDKYQVFPAYSLNTPFPGTYQYDHRDELGLTLHAESWDQLHLAEPVVSTAAFDRNHLRDIYYQAQDRLMMRYEKYQRK